MAEPEEMEIVVLPGNKTLAYLNQLIAHLERDDVQERADRERIAKEWREKATKKGGMSTALADAIVVVALDATTDIRL